MLKTTSKCHYCHRKTDGLFCKMDHEVKYNLRQKHQTEHRAEARRRALYGDWTPKGGTVAQRIDAIVARAVENGTCYVEAKRVTG